jgi:hypothetical protein
MSNESKKVVEKKASFPANGASAWFSSGLRAEGSRARYKTREAIL